MTAAERNPRGLSDEALKILLNEDKCPMCIGDLDAVWECNSCGYDAKPLVERLTEVKRVERLRRYMGL